MKNGALSNINTSSSQGPSFNSIEDSRIFQIPHLTSLKEKSCSTNHTTLLFLPTGHSSCPSHGMLTGPAAAWWCIVQCSACFMIFRACCKGQCLRKREGLLTSRTGILTINVPVATQRDRHWPNLTKLQLQTWLSS